MMWCELSWCCSSGLFYLPNFEDLPGTIQFFFTMFWYWRPLNSIGFTSFFTCLYILYTNVVDVCKGCVCFASFSTSLKKRFNPHLITLSFFHSITWFFSGKTHSVWIGPLGIVICTVLLWSAQLFLLSLSSLPCCQLIIPFANIYIQNHHP